MNTLTKAKTATVDAAFREVAQDVIMSSAAAPQKSAKCDVKQVSVYFARERSVVIRLWLRYRTVKTWSNAVCAVTSRKSP